MRPARLALLALAPALLAAGCGGERSAPVASLPPTNAPTSPSPTPSAPAVSGPVLAPDGTCTGPAPGTAAAIAPGIAECDLVRLKGRPPTDVLVGESGRGGREVQVLYSEPGRRELYFFVNNRLDRVVQ